ncbi:putative neutral and basic amino acid transport protein rBAT [Apostichopus japonicus]|uniref:Putative neutral and basic amino acid transport protein rBAT n=1 Tax=Stichopus japonicus TaxID=307972 RepID=A0A2G8JV29_STIJA|nr:putative neutral and basic amino acid transport protein rBAT [Apostichopus japonicus]
MCMSLLRYRSILVLGSSALRTYQKLLKELFLFLPYYFRLQVNMYGGSAWTLDETRGQYYLHQFSEFQPDLNLDEDNVLQYLEDSMEQWFAMGVDGLNIQGTQFLFEGPIHKDEPVNDNYNGELEGYDSLLHYYTSDYTGVHELLNTWREGIFFRYSTAGTYRLMITDSDTNSTYLGNYYGTDDNPEADLAKNYNLFNIGDVNGDGGRTSGTEIDELLRDWLNALPDGEWPSFQLGSHNARRIASRLSHPYVKVANMLLLTLPGTPICYYGDEIGMKDTMIETYEDVQDIKGKNDQVNWFVKTRDPERGPMQWNDSANAGFSKSEPWLPVADNYNVVNVERQLDQEFSNLGVFKKTVAFRSDNRAFLSTDIQMLEHENDITAYIRSSDEQSERFLVVLSFSDEHMNSDLFNKNNDLPLEGTVRVATDDDREGKVVQLNKLSIFGGEGLIIELH